MSRVSWIFIAVLAGLAAAALHASMVTVSPLSVILFYLAPLPLFITGLSYGWVPAALAAAAGTLATAALAGLRPALFFLAMSAAAPVVLSRLALINRPAVQAAGEGEAKDGGIEWYPEGRLVLWVAFFAGILLTLMVIVAGPDAESFRATLKQISETITAPIVKDMTPEQVQGLRELVDVLVFVAPLASAAMWLLATLVNLVLASRLLRRWGTSLRPWAPFSSLAFPPRSGLALVATTAGSFLPGTLGLVSSVFAAPLAAAFMVLGLSVVHHLVRRSTARVLLLVGLYAGLFLLSWLLVVPLIVLGLAELLFGIRARADRHAIAKPNT
ncbi:MAG TPA: DUF2232 domain-containing protein [Aestuariivirgaceae bacterium]|nr:DUF2232 domain-containing protein [Aestuariivirgaceae bacterium]